MWSNRSRLAVCLVLSAGLAMPVWAGDPGDDSHASAEQPSGAFLAFNFKDAPFEQVLDFFSRESGLPIIREANPPNATMTFISAKRYTFDEALSILNLNLKMHNLYLRREENFLYLATLEGSFQKPTPILNGRVDESVPDDRIVTVTIPLSNALAPIVGEQIKPLIGSYGGVQAVPAQNMLIITETAGQVRRLSEIIRAIDSEKPIDSSTEIFPLRHTDPQTVVGALKALIGERIKKVIVDKNGKQTVVEEETVPQVQLYPDARTNTVLATGAKARIETVRELIALLDVPEGAGAGEQEMMTFALGSITSDEAARHLNALFSAIPEARRPRVLPLAEVNKITVVAPSSLLLQARALLSEIDPGEGGGEQDPTRVARTIRLEHVDARSVEQIVSRLLTARQRQQVRWASTRDPRALLVVGSPGDVAAFEELVRGVDVAPESRPEVRIVEVSAPDPAALLEQTRRLYDELERDDERELRATLDGDGRTLTLIGTREQIDAFQQLMRQAQSLVRVESETRRYELRVRRPSELARELPRLVRPLLDPGDGRPIVQPRFEALDELDTLIVRAASGQFETIEELIARLDSERPGDRDFRVIRIARGDLETIAQRAQELFGERAQGRDDLAAPSVRVDPDSGSLLVSGEPEALRLFDQAVREAQQLLPPTRTTRLYDIQHVDAREILEPLGELLGAADPIDESRRVPDPTISVVERTNSLLVTAEPAQHQLIADYVRRLDRLEPTDLPPLKLLQLRTADAVAIAQMLTAQYAKRPQSDRSARPVEVRADASTNTLIVSAHPELFEEIRAFVDELNKERDEGPERITFLFPLKVAKAVDVAQAMDKLYPEPPMPRDRRGNPMPWLQKEKEVTVSADPSSNSLIIDAPADRRESLEELAQKLDRVEVPQVAQLRTYRIEKADLQAIARTLQNLARNGNLSAPGKSGAQPVRVVIETEPKSQTLIVAGDEVTFERVEQMLKDLSAVPVERGLRIVPIANADASEIRDRALAIYQAQVAQIPGAGPVDVTVDERSNSLEVVADAEAMDRFMRVLDELQRQAGPEREVRLIELRYAQASTVVSFLRDLVDSSASFRAGGGPEPVIEAIEATNTLMVAAEPGQLRLIESLVRNMDNQREGEMPPIRILRLRSTDAVNLAGVLQRTYDRRPVEDKALRPVSIQADSATNTLIVSAHEELLGEIEQIVTELNEQQAYDEEGREIRIFPLQVARAEELARTIDAMFPEPPVPIDPRTRRPRPDLRQPKEVVVRADPATNSLIVDAPAKRLAGFEQIVRSLDQHKLSDTIEVRTYRVQRAELNAVSNTLRQLARNGALGATGQTPVTVEVEPMSRSLIVSGPQGIFERVEAVLGELDTRADLPETTMRLYALKHARADRIQPLLERLLMQRVAEDRLRQGEQAARELESLLEVAADSASNTLIVNAPESIQQIAQQVIESLDVEAAQIGRRIIRVVPLTFADAGEVSRTLMQARPGIEWPSGGENLTIVPAAGSNALILSGVAKDLDKLEELIEPLDRRPSDDEAPGVETFQLRHAEAGAIAATVERLLGDQLASDPRVLAAQLRYFRGQIPRRATVRVQADERTNALIVSGPRASLELAREIIQRLDEPAEDAQRTILTFTPARADPKAMIPSVQRVIDAMFPNARRPLELVHEARTGSIIIIGDAEQAAEAARRLSDLDERTPALPAVELRLFELANSDARAVAQTVQSMLGDRSRWPEELLRAQRAGLSVPEPRVNADPQGNRLIVSAPRALVALADEIVRTLDTPSSSTSTDLRVFRLSSGDAQSIAEALRTALSADLAPGEAPATVTAEPRSNSVLVSASADRLEQAASIIEEMDAQADVAGVQVRTIFLEHARAESLAPLVEQVLQRQSELDLLPAWQVSTYLSRRRPGEPLPQPVRVLAESRLNAIIVSAPVSVLALAEDVVRELDVSQESTPDARIVRVLTPVNADAQTLADNLMAVLDDEDSGERPPVIRVDADSNTLIVRAGEAQIARIESLVEQIDRATLATSREMRLIRVDPSRVEASVMARTLKQLLEQSSPVRVEVIDAKDLLDTPRDRDGSTGSNRLDIRALQWLESTRPSTIEAIRALVFQAAVGTMIAPEAVIQPADEAPESEDDDAHRMQDGGEPPGAVTIAVDPATNSLIVLGSTRIAEHISRLVEDLQTQFPRSPTSVHLVRLPEGVDPRAVTNIVRETIRQVGAASRDNPGGLTGRVAVSPDVTGGGVVVWANDADFEVVGRLIGSLASGQSTTSLSVRVYPLTNIDANQAARAVRDLVSPRPVGRQAQRLRTLDLTLQGEGGAVQASIDPSLVSTIADPSGSSLIVSAPSETLALIDSFVSLIDQSPVSDRLAIRQYTLENARAVDLARTFQALFDAQRAGARNPRSIPRTRFVADARTNALLVTASDEQHAEVARLIASADAELADDDLETEFFTLQQAQPTNIARVIRDVLVGRDPAKQEKIQVSADNGSSVLVVKAPPEEMEQVRALVAQVDQAETGGLPLRTIKLEQADAQIVAQSLQQFFRQRDQIARQQGRRVRSGVAIVGDRKSGTLVVAASDEDFRQIEELIPTFDEAAPARVLDIRVIALQNARVSDIEETITNLTFQLGGGFFFRGRGQQEDDILVTQVNQRANSVVLIGTGERLETFERIVRSLDIEPADQTRRVVRAVEVQRADPQVLARVISQSMATPGWRPWMGPDPDGVSVEVDRTRRMLFVTGAAPRVDEALAQIEQIDAAATGEGHRIRTFTLEHARADRAARSLQQFFRDRARTEGRPANEVAIVGSSEGNVLIVSGNDEALKTVEGLIADLDQPELGDDRAIHVYSIKNAEVREVARAVSQMFPQQRREDRVIVTPQDATGSLIVSAPSRLNDEIAGLIDELDRAPSTDDVTFTSVPLEKARAEDIARTLEQSLPDNIKVQITPVPRSNSLLLTGSSEAIDLVRTQIEALDTEPPRILQEVRRIPIQHADVYDVWFSVTRLAQNRFTGPEETRPRIDYIEDENTLIISATPEQLEDLQKLIAELDTPGDSNRSTEFIKLRFAEADTVRRALEMFYGRFASEADSPAARRVSIVTDEATNSLVISAGEDQWGGIRALIEKLDTADYDTSRQIEVIPLAHADAVSVAQALNEGFGSQLRRQAEVQRAREQQHTPERVSSPSERSSEPPPVLISTDDEVPVVSAEPQTNAIIVFADRESLERIREIVKQLDLPDVLRLPAPRVIPIQSGRASEVARAVREAFASMVPRQGSTRGVMIFGDDASNTIIVRADDDRFEMIRELVETLEGHVDSGRMSPRVLRVANLPAARLQQTILRTFRPVAQQAGEQLSVEIERQTNALVIASSERLFEEIRRLVDELDQGLDGVTGTLGQSVIIIDVENNTPEQVRQILEQMGVTRPAPPDRPGVVSEPVTIVPLRTRSSLAIVASPADAQTLTALVRQIDAEPAGADQRVEIVPLRLADAGAVVRTLQGMLRSQQASPAAPAQALAEQIRRLTIASPDWNRDDIRVDLSLPISLSVDTQTNAVIITSSEGNVRALTEIVRMLDTLPLGDAVVVRIFPLENASAARMRAIVEQLFRQGEALRRLPGTQRQGLPSTITGQALAGEIAASVDERTNALIVAGREEAVAFVETLVSQLDSDDVSSWVEPAIIPLEHADPVRLAQTLRQVLVEGLRTPPQAVGIQQQVARLRVLHEGGDPKGVQSDIFAPMTGLVITPEENMGSIIVVGSTGNVAVVRELIAMLDVPASGADNEVRVFPLEHAAADRVAQIVRRVFDERAASGAIREEDRLIITSDTRTNALIVSTSPRSYEILEGLLETLDAKETDASVGVHVLHVPDTDVRELARIIERLMTERIRAAQQAGVPRSPSDAFRVEPEPATSSLIIAASDENLQVVRELIETLTSEDLVDRGGQVSELIYVEKGQADDLAQAIRELYVDRENELRGERSVTIVPNERLNVLIATGTPEDIASIRALVERLSTAEVKTEQEIRRIELRTANALEVVNLIQQVLAGRTISGSRRGAGQATRIRFYRDRLESDLREQMGDEVTEAEIDDALRQQIRLTPDLRTNSVVVAAPAEIMKLIVEIIDDLDTTTAGNRNIEMFRLKNADAFAMAEVLRDLFNLSQDGNRFVLIPSPLYAEAPEGSEDEFENLFGGTTVTPVPDERQELSLTIDPRTNTLLVSGTAEYLELVRKVVKELDTIEATQRERLVYHLRNAKAVEVEETLRDYFQSEADRIRQTLRPEQIGSLARLLEQEVTIVGDEKSNKLVVSASPRYIETIRGIIEELDAAPPQVVIEVLLAEVTIDRANTWGMDLRVGPLGGDNYLINSTPAGGAVTTALGLPTLSIASDDFGLLVRALEEQGRLQVLSRPSVTVNNNESAEIQVGDDVAIVDSVSTFLNGNTSANVVRRNVGILVQVTPTISSDGFVRLEIEPEISNLSNRTTQVGQGIESPIIAQRRVETVVTVMDGQTVVIGGLIQHNSEDRKTKVPLLGDIPGIGRAFQTDQFSDVRTELLIIMTPKIIRGAADVDLQSDLSNRAIDEVSARRSIRDLLEAGLSGADGKAPTVSPNADQAVPAQPPADEPEGLLVRPAPTIDDTIRKDLE